jgi:hypothetical protein
VDVRKSGTHDKPLGDRIVGSGQVFRLGVSRKGAKAQRERKKEMNIAENEIAKTVGDAGYCIHISA